jgi:hypothetical protein
MTGILVWTWNKDSIHLALNASRTVLDQSIFSRSFPGIPESCEIGGNCDRSLTDSCVRIKMKLSGPRIGLKLPSFFRIHLNQR